MHTTNSSWTALRNPAFRRLWVASLVSGTCVAAHDNAATYLMDTLAASPFLISAVSTAASLPFFLFTLPAGVLADRVSHKRLLCAVNLWLAIAAAALAILGWLHLLNPYLILVAVFLIGIGFAFNAPASTSIVAQIVSDTELPSAAALNGLQFNVSGIVGPALGGFLVLLVGANLVFILNAACFLLVIVSVLQWKQRNALSTPSSESFCQSFGTAFRYIRCAPEFQMLLMRNFLFALFISAIPALLPVVGLQVLQLSSSKLGLLFTSMGIGSTVTALLLIPWFRARFSPNTLMLSANLLVILAYVLMALVRQTELFLLVAALAGAGWTLSASELWVAAQRTMPEWARGRLNATIMMTSQGGMVLGGLVWGATAAIVGPGYALFGAATLFLITLILSVSLSINFTASIRERVLNGLSANVKSPEAAPAALTPGLLAV